MTNPLGRPFARVRVTGGFALLASGPSAASAFTACPTEMDVNEDVSGPITIRRTAPVRADGEVLDAAESVVDADPCVPREEAKSRLYADGRGDEVDHPPTAESELRRRRPRFAEEARELRANDSLAFDRLVRETHDERGTSVTKRGTTATVVRTFPDVVEDYRRVNRSDASDEQGRRPPVATTRGRMSIPATRDTAYRMTRPCECGECPHDLRRTWGTLLVEREVEPGLVMERGGWEDWETFREHYLGAYSLDAQQRGMEKVDWL